MIGSLVFFLLLLFLLFCLVFLLNQNTAVSAFIT